jgi:hypothetical protein
MALPYNPTSYHAELWDQLTPLAYDDANQNYALFNYLGAIASMSDQVETYSRDGTNGEPGWSIVMDIDRAPSEVLPWLGQFVGVQVNTALSDTDQRNQIRNAGGMQRGKIGAMVAAVQPLLTGTKTVMYRERDASVSSILGGAYGLTILTLTSETPDSSKALAALTAAKPAGIIRQYSTVAGATYLVIRTNYSTYTTLRSAFLTYAGLRNNIPGT